MTASRLPPFVLDELAATPTAEQHTESWPLYRRVLVNHAEELLRGERHLFCSRDVEILECLVSKLDDGAQSLLCRLTLRAWRWVRVSSFATYVDVADVDVAVNALVVHGLLHTMPHPGPAPTLLTVHPWIQLLLLGEMRLICKEMGLKTPPGSKPVSAAAKDDLAALLSRACGTRARKISELACAAIGKCVLLDERIPRLVDRMNLVYFRHRAYRQQTMITRILDAIHAENYVEYAFKRTSLYFDSCEHVDEYEEALKLQDLLESASSAHDANDVFDTIMPKWSEIIEAKRGHPKSDAYWFQRFTAGWAHTKTLELYLPWLSKQKRHAELAALCEKLIGQSMFRRGKRGEWFKIAALMYHVHLKDFQASHDACLRGLKDPHCSPSHALALHERLERLLKSKWGKDLKQTFVPLNLKEAPTDSFFARRAHASLAQKYTRPMYHYHDEIVNVEEYALCKYAESAGYRGIHAETAILTTIFAHLLFEEIFDTSIQGVFETQYQDSPMDFATDAFYDARKEKIDQKISRISAGEHMTIFYQVRELHEAKQPHVRGLRWEIDRGDLEAIIKGLGAAVLADLCAKFAKNYAQYCSGGPDLCLWRNAAHGDGVEICFVEVKGPGDSLFEKQRIWIDTLLNLGIDVRTCHIVNDDDEIKARPRKRKRVAKSGV